MKGAHFVCGTHTSTHLEGDCLRRTGHLEMAKRIAEQWQARAPTSQGDCAIRVRVRLVIALTQLSCCNGHTAMCCAHPPLVPFLCGADGLALQLKDLGTHANIRATLQARTRAHHKTFRSQTLTDPSLYPSPDPSPDHELPHGTLQSHCNHSPSLPSQDLADRERSGSYMARVVAACDRLVKFAHGDDVLCCGVV